MEFVNHTPFPAMAFSGIDQHGRPFDVVVLRQTFSFISGGLEYADVQSPLCEVDEPFKAGADGDVRQESDLAPFKPQCDVIVNATAYAPAGKPRTAFDVRLVVAQQAASATGASAPVALIDKTLTVHGARQFIKRSLWSRACRRLLTMATLGAARPVPWKQTKPLPFDAVPLRYALAFGGQWRIDADAPRADKVPRAHRLPNLSAVSDSAASASAHMQPVAHALFEFNPGGLGYAPAWALKATGCTAVAAPRVERAAETLSANMFWRWQASESGAPTCAKRQSPAGMGIRPKTHPHRAAMLGTVDAAFIGSDKALPSDFDFGYYNAAPPDQQIAYLRNDEIIDLHNLCRPDTAGLRSDGLGNAVMRLALPRHECFCLLRLGDGRLSAEPMALDTVLIEPDDHALVLVWRLALPRDEAAPVRACEARMWSHEERDRIRAMQEALAALKRKGGTANAARPAEVSP